MAEPTPLREPTFLILATLASGPAHGYGVIKAVEELSGGRVKLRAGTLYGALDRLEADGYVKFQGSSSDGGPPRKYYVLTPAGAELLRAEAERQAANAQVALERLGMAGS